MPKGFISTIILLGAAFVILLGGVVVYQKVFVPQTQPSSAPTITPTPNLTAGWVPQKACLENNGKWAEDYKECGGISKDVCQSIGGKFNDCASPCRHDPQVESCIMMCEETCSF